MYRRCRFEERVANERGVFAIMHPDAFLDARRACLISPHRNCAFQANTFDVLVPKRRNGAATPAMRRQFETLIANVNVLVQPADQKSPSRWRIECGEKQAVIASRR